MKWFALILILITAYFNFMYFTSPYYQVKRGDKVLYCYMKDGYKKINTNKITGFIDEKNIWIFENGYAKNCEVKDD